MTAEPLTDQQLAEIRSREAAATKGPWYFDGDHVRGFHPEPLLGRQLAQFECYSPYHRAQIDGEFAAHARQDVPLLLAELDRLRAQRDQWERAAEETGLLYAGAENQRDDLRAALEPFHVAVAAHTEVRLYADIFGCGHPEPEETSEAWEQWSEDHPIGDEEYGNDGRICHLSPTDESVCSTCRNWDDEPVPWALCAIGKLAATPHSLRPGCPDPIECDHEAKVGQLRAELEQTRQQTAAVLALLPADPADDINASWVPLRLIRAAATAQPTCTVRACGCPSRFDRHADGCPTLTAEVTR